MNQQDLPQPNATDSRQPSIWRWRMRHILFSVVLIGMGIVFLSFLGNKYTLACNRINASQFDCSVKTDWFGLFQSADQRTIRHLQSAQLGTSCGKSTTCTYRVELVADQGVVPLIAGYTADGEVKSALVNRINGYINDAQNKAFSVVDGFNILFLAIPFAFIAGGIFNLIRRWH